MLSTDMDKARGNVLAGGRNQLTLAGRIKIGMAQAGIASPSELARRMRVNRQTVHNWIAGKGRNISPDMLFLLSDVLGVNARWLAMGHPQSPIKPHSPSVEEAELLEIYSRLPSAAKETWLGNGRDLLKLLTPSSAANPFSKTKN